MSIREGFEWTEVEPPVRCVCVCVLQIDREIDRQTGGKKQKERETKRQRHRAVSLFIDSHVCTDESLGSSSGASRCASSPA